MVYAVSGKLTRTQKTKREKPLTGFEKSFFEELLDFQRQFENNHNEHNRVSVERANQTR